MPRPHRPGRERGVTMRKEWVLWGGREGYERPIRLTGGTKAHCEQERKFRAKDSGWWLMVASNTYASSEVRDRWNEWKQHGPEALRTQALRETEEPR